MSDVHADLQALAGKVAESLVARALQDLAFGVAPMTITVRSVPIAIAPKRLGPAKPKAGKKPKPSAKGTASAPAAEVDIARRMCRKCFRRGTAQRIKGTDRGLHCTRCGHTWELRATPAGAKRQPYRTAKRRAALCGVCDHPAIEHLDFTGACGHVGGCVCKGFAS
jgi:hypothetical protein